MAAEQEFAQRLADLGEGPWVEDGSLAQEFLTPPEGVVELAHSDKAVDLIALPVDRKRSQRTRNDKRNAFLRPHWAMEITKPAEMEVRDSLDAAMTHLQILELAVETGYLREEDVREEARRKLLSLLWSPAARGFVQNYDYIAVDFLAARVGIAGLSDVTPPAPDPGGAIRFAGFLSQHAALIQDRHVDEWLKFLDDYVEEEDEQKSFYEYLEVGHNNRHPRKRFQRLAVGAQRLIVYLADLFGTLKTSELARFGLFYQYWLAKLYGYELSAGTYVRDEAWGKSDSWAEAIRRSPLFKETAPAGGEADQSPSPLERDLEIVNTAWEATKALISTARARRASIQIADPSPNFL